MSINKKRQLQVDICDTFEPEAKRTADAADIDGLAKSVSSIILHTDVMSTVIEYVNDPSDVACLQIALKKFWPPIASRVLNLVLHGLCGYACHIAAKFCNLQRLKIRCTKTPGRGQCH